jgi:hypothetical protein
LQRKYRFIPDLGGSRVRFMNHAGSLITRLSPWRGRTRPSTGGRKSKTRQSIGSDFRVFVRTDPAELKKGMKK